MESKDMTCIHGLRLDWFYQSGKYAFQFLFGEKFNSFKNIFDHNIDQLKKQLEKEELHECDSKECLAVLKKQFEIFFDPKSSLSYSYQYQSNLARQKEKFQEYAHYDTESLKKTILSYQNSIEKRIDERACHEEELRIKERNVKERRNKVKWLNEIELQKQESMMNVGTILNDSLDVIEQPGESSNPGKDTDAAGAKIHKNGSDYYITIDKFSHDKDKTEVHWSNNGLFENDHEVEKTNENNKSLKEANDLLTKELKTYKEKGHISSVIQDQDTLKANLKHREDKYLNEILDLQNKNKDLTNIVCKIGKSTKTLRLLTNEQRAYRDNIRKSGLGYKGPCVLSQANAKNPKLYNAYELYDENAQLHVFDSEETLEDAEKSQLKMKEFQKDEKVQDLKIEPIDYLKLNKLYETFVPQVELSLEQKYFSETFIPSENPSNASTSKSPYASMPSLNNMKLYLEKIGNEISPLFELLQKSSKRESIFYTSPEQIRLTNFCQQKVKPILHNLHFNLEIFQKLFSEDINEMMDVFDSMESDLDKTLKQNEHLKNRLLEATLAKDVKNLVITSCVEIRNKKLQDEIERFSKASKDVSNESQTANTCCNDAFDVTKELSKRIVDWEKKFKTRGIKSRVETNQCDEVQVKFDFAEIETKNIELEHQVASLLKENKHLKLVYKNLFDSIKKSRPLTQNLNIPQNEAEKLKSDVSEVVDKKSEHILGKDDSSPSSITKSNISKLEKESGENICENAKCDLQTKIVELEKF
ncbi:hypothetical protein Tco_0145153 [Tanacetum coccineum]